MEGHTRINQIPQLQIMKKMVKERNNNVCVAVKREVRVMKNVLNGLPDKIRDQLSRHHTQNKSTSNVHIF